MTKIATWNVNSIKARMPNVLGWLAEARPDVALLQETKTVDDDFPRLELEALGFHLALCGQKAYNGVAVLSRLPIREVRRDLPGLDNGEARYIETDLEGGPTVASVYVVNGQAPDSPQFPRKLEFLDALRRRVRHLLAEERPFVLGGDFNVAPEPIDVYDPRRWEGRVLFHPEERRRLRALLHLGLTDAFRALHPGEHGFSWWDYRSGAWAQDLGVRIDHLLLSPQAADRLIEAEVDRWCRDREKCSDHAPVWCRLG